MWKVLSKGEVVAEFYTAREAFDAAAKYSREHKLTTRVLKPGESAVRQNANISRVLVQATLLELLETQKTKAGTKAVNDMIAFVGKM